MSRPSFEQINMAYAEMLSERSTCARQMSDGSRAAVGCVITSEDFRQVYGIGYNGGAAGLKNDCDRHGAEAVGNCGCFISGTKVSATGVTRAYRRRYEGEVVQVITAMGEFTATPNHPILTLGRGWVPAQLLQEGDQLLRTAWGEKMPSRVPHDYNDIPIEEVFDSLRVAGRLVGRGGTRHDFHGDGLVGQDVDVVTIDSGLPSHREPVFREHGSEPGFSGTLRVSAAFSRLRTVAQLVSRTLWDEAGLQQAMADDDGSDAERSSDGKGSFTALVASNDVFKREFNHRLSLVPAEVLGHLAKNAEFSKTLLNAGVRNTEGTRNIENLVPGPIATSDVRHIKKKSWSGHVYNLETASNWYTISEESYIAHNCIHAEQNAVVNNTAPRSVGTIVFCTHLPCVTCAKFLINLGGVKRVFYRNDYRIKDSLWWFKQSGILTGWLQKGFTDIQAISASMDALHLFIEQMRSGG